MGPIRATYENGVFKPKEVVSLPDGCVVTLRVRAIVSSDGSTLVVLDPDGELCSGKGSTDDRVE